MGNDRWTKEEISILFGRYPKLGSDILELNRTKLAISCKAHRLRLKVNPGVRGKKISKGKLGKPRSKETKEKISKAHIGKTLSKETKEKISLALIGQIPWIKGKHHSKEAKEKIRIATVNRKPTFINTSIEVALQEKLNKLGIIYQTHIPLCNCCRPDILFPDEKIAIFADGDYWHSIPKCIERDKRQDDILTNNGWIVLRFKGDKIRKDIDLCIAEILHTLEEVP